MLKDGGDYIRCVIPGARDRRCIEDMQVVDEGISLAQRYATIHSTSARASSSTFESEVDLLEEVSFRGPQDEAVLMQYGPVMPESSHTPSSVATRAINIYAWGQDYIDVPVEEHMTMVESITHHWGIEGNDIIDLHEVLEPPIPLQVPGELVFVMEMRGDGQHRLLEDDKLILAEVRIASASLRTSKMNRIVLWSRLLMQRPQAFVLLRMDEFCARRGTRECILLHNNRVWTKDDRSSHRMENGDFLMIEAFVDDLSFTEAWNELKRYEGA